jgi:hypothetical protein
MKFLINVLLYRCAFVGSLYSINSKKVSPYYQNICKTRIFAIVSKGEITEILKEAKSTHSSEYSSGSPDKPGLQRNRFCDANSASARASKSAQLNSSTSSNMATYYREFPLN